MIIELKRIAYNPRLDEHTFAANLFIDGEKAATVSNKNGQAEYYAIDERGLEIIARAEEYLKKQPREKRIVDGQEQTARPTLTSLIDSLFSDYLTGIEQKKFTKKVELIQKRNIVIGEPGRYMRTYPLGALASIMLGQARGQEQIKNILATKVLPTLSEKEQILSTNIPASILKEAGLKPDQYLVRDEEQEIKKATKKSQGLKH